MDDNRALDIRFTMTTLLEHVAIRELQQRYGNDLQYTVKPLMEHEWQELHRAIDIGVDAGLQRFGLGLHLLGVMPPGYALCMLYVWDTHTLLSYYAPDDKRAADDGA